MISILDCTLRDGGYINGWYFGKECIIKTVNALEKSGINIIELGFVKNGYQNDDACTIKQTITSFENLVNSSSTIYTVMINVGECESCDFSDASLTKIRGIRIAFKKKDRKEAIALAADLINKHYLVFLQPMVTLDYSDQEFIELIQDANLIKPFAFYIVDSFGEMEEEQVCHYKKIAEKYLMPLIKLGFHSHNNLQLSFSNCKFFVNDDSVHDIIVDSSIYGMGRGAGNLNTEVFIDYLNRVFNAHYLINPIINIIDLFFDHFYKERQWGYSIPYYLSAKNHVHPNYALFLDEKKTLTYLDIEKILASIDNEKKTIFDVNYVKQLYLKYQGSDDRSSYFELIDILVGKTVVLLGPGQSLKNGITLSNVPYDIIIGVNHYPPYLNSDFVFFSNDKRYNQFEHIGSEIITSNVNGNGNYVIPYFELINDNDIVFDNSLLMCLKFLKTIGVKKVYLAGFDGYTDISANDYFHKDMLLGEKISKKYLNYHIALELKEYIQYGFVSFLTYSKYIDEVN